MDFQDYYFAVKERLWLVLLVFIVCVSAGGVYLVRTKPVYGSKAVLMIEQREARVMRGDPVEQTDPTSPDFMNTIVESIRSRTILQRVVENLNLQDDLVFMEKKADGGPGNKADAIVKLSNCVKIVLRQRTRLVDIYALHTDPEMTRVLADAVAREFIRFGFEQRLVAARMANQFLLEEASKLRDKVRQSEQAMQEYREKNQAASLEGNQNLVLAQLQDLNTRLNQARSDRLNLETDFTRSKEIAGRTEELMRIPSIARLPNVANIMTAIASKEIEFASLKQQYLPKHPKYITAVSEMNRLKLLLEEKVNEGAGLLASSFEVAKENEKRLAELVVQQEKASLELNKKAIEYNVIKSERETDNAMYQSVLSRVKEIDVTQGIDSSPIKLVEVAVTPFAPSFPSWGKFIFGSIALGLVLGIGSALGLNMLNPGLKTVTHAESRIGLPVFSAVPNQKGPRDQNIINDTEGPHGLVKEAFRTLRTQLLLLGKQEDRRTFLVTSALPAEGKTFISCNIAAVFAQGDMKTLLIDADLRKPTVAEVFFGKKDDSPGLSDLLLERASFKDVTRETNVKNLSVITAGTRVKNPAELLTKLAIKKIIDEALLTYDRVIVDTAPVLAVSDTLLIAAEAQTVFLAVLTGSTPAKAVERACRSLTEAGKAPSGIVMNRMKGGQSYYYYGHYGSKEVYGAAEAKS